VCVNKRVKHDITDLWQGIVSFPSERQSELESKVAVVSTDIMLDSFYLTIFMKSSQRKAWPRSCCTADENSLTTVHKPDKTVTVQGAKKAGKVTVCFSKNAMGGFYHPIYNISVSIGRTGCYMELLMVMLTQPISVAG
jgi:hypothetical protein